MPDTDQILRDLLARVDALEARIDLLNTENRTLRGELADVQAVVPPMPIASSSATAMERLSRRWLLRRGMQLTAASVAAGVLAQRTAPSASASHTGDNPDFDTVYAHQLRGNSGGALPGVYAEANGGASGAIYAQNIGAGPAVYAESASANSAIEGKSNNANGSGVWGRGKTGVIGASSHGSGSGVFGSNLNNVGVLGDGAVGVKGTSSKANFAATVGEHTGTVGYGVLGVGTGSGVGVLGRNAANEGVRGEGTIGVYGTSSTANYTAVVGEHTGTVGYGVLGVGKGSATGVLGRNAAGEGVRGEGQVGVIGTSSVANYTAVVGEHTGSVGYGVLGQGTGSGVGVLGRNGSGEGVRGEGRTGVFATSTAPQGYGAVIEGGKAQLRLIPRTTAGKPTGTHSKGEIYLDSTGTLFICTAPGTPGTWRKVSTTVA